MGVLNILKNYSYIRLDFENQESITINRKLVLFLTIEDIVKGYSYDSQFKGEESNYDEFKRINEFELGLDISNIYPNESIQRQKEKYDLEDTFFNRITTDENENILYRLIDYKNYIDVDGIAFLDNNKKLMEEFSLPYNTIQGKEGNIDYNDNADIEIYKLGKYRLGLYVNKDKDFSKVFENGSKDLLEGLIVGDKIVIQEDDNKFYLTSKNTIKIDKVQNFNTSNIQTLNFRNIVYYIKQKYGKIGIGTGVNLSCILTEEEKKELDGKEK